MIRFTEGQLIKRSRLIMAGGLAILLLATSTIMMLPAAFAGEAASDLDWTLGIWEGVRRDGADGSEAAMTMRVEAILGGAGQIRHIEIPHEGGVYRGFAVQVFDEQSGRWVRHYTNAGRGRFSSLEGEGNLSRWWVTSAGVAAGIDMALAVVESLHGTAVANDTARYIDYPRSKAQS